MIAAYCDMVHNYKSYEMLPARLQRGFLDCGSVVTRKDAASVGWRSMDHSSDWIYFEDIIRKYGADKWLKIPGYTLSTTEPLKITNCRACEAIAFTPTTTSA